jgi:hypothetical protein
MKIAFAAFPLLLFMAVAAQAQVAGSVCYQPSARCSTSHSFATNQLPFVIKEKLVFGKSYRSQQFYAVILKSVKIGPNANCSEVSEAERLQAQSIWPTRKVFTSRLSCPEELVFYEKTEQTVNFLAVYAGNSLSEARRVLNEAKAKGHPQAYIKRMRVVLDYST